MTSSGVLPLTDEEDGGKGEAARPESAVATHLKGYIARLRGGDTGRAYVGPRLLTELREGAGQQVVLVVSHDGSPSR